MADVRDDDVNVTIDVGPDGQLAAERLKLALQSGDYGRLDSPRLDGEVSYPRVAIWRSRGVIARSPYAQFEGTFRESDGMHAIVGRVSVPVVGQLHGTLIGMWFMFIGLVAVAVGVSTGKLLPVLICFSFAAIVALYFYALRRMAIAGARAEGDMLVRELRRLISTEVTR